MGNVLAGLVFQYVEIEHVLMFGTAAAQVIVLKDIRLESLFPQIYLALALVAADIAVFKPVWALPLLMSQAEPVRPGIVVFCKKLQLLCPRHH